jgi:HEAT repeat protein
MGFAKLLLPADYSSAPVFDLLTEVEAGRVGFDHRVIAACEARPAETGAAIARFAAEERPERLLDLAEELTDVIRHVRLAEGLPFLIRVVRAAPEDIPDPVVEALVAIGAPAVDPLLALLKEVLPEQRGDVLFLLAAVGVRDERILAELTALLPADPHEAALGLGLYADPAAIPAIEAAIAASADEDARHSLRDALGSIAQAQKEPPRQDVTDIREIYPEEADPIFDALQEADCLRFLECAEARYRTETALSFIDEGYSPDVRAKLIELARTDPDSDVRGAALAALGEAITDPKVRGVLIDALEDETKPILERGGALIGLSSRSQDGRVHRRMVEFYTTGSLPATALQAMWRSGDARYRQYFEDALQSENLAVVRQAISGVGVYPLANLAAKLTRFFADDTLREDALYAYALAAPGKTTAEGVHKLFEEIEETAGGLSASEQEIAGRALDARLERAGLDPEFYPDEEEAGGHVHGPGCGHGHGAPEQPLRSEKIGRNDPCPCGSGKKYKKCCGA